MAVPFKIDLSGKVAVVTGGGGILCSIMAEAIAECGAKVAILDLNNSYSIGLNPRDSANAVELSQRTGLRRLLIT